MKVKKGSGKLEETDRVAAVRRILSIAQLVRRNGTPNEADEALEWEKLLERRLQEIEAGAVAQAA